MPATLYQDFELQLGPGTAAGYELAARAPAGEARGAFSPPLAQAIPQATGAGPLDTASAQAIGAALFGAAFTGDILSLYDASRALARRDGAGIRLRLRILAPELAARPWEMLYDARQSEFISLSQQTPIVRMVETLAPLQPLAVTPPLRILGLVASPANVPPLDVDREKNLLGQAVGTADGQLELAWAAGGSWRALQEQLQQGPWHIFHFIGHGYFDGATGESALLLADEDGRAAPRNSTEIARLLADQPTLRLVVLNACEGAHAGTQTLYASIAEHLARRGLPAVLAMQDVIADTAAAEFTRSFYGALSHALPVDAACAEARKAMSLAAPYSSGWATPVLFLRSADGALWARADQATGGEMDANKTQPWWEQVSNAIGSVDASHAAGDVIIAVVGAGARNVAAGKNITQTVNEVLGPPAPDDSEQVKQGFAALVAALARLPVDAGAAERAKMRIELLQEELTRRDDETPNAATITSMGDWLLNNVPALAGALGDLFALPAAGRVLGRAGEPAVKWVQQRFGKP